MAIFDPAEQRMCVRIVYDGVANAGKTTNLKMLCGLFATQRRTELYTPGELDGRTLYFDWLQIMAGAVCGFPLMCQVISVPGQVALTPRRRHLLATADVVVLVCDSSAARMDSIVSGLRVLDEIAGARDLPVIVQANKQDQVDALTGPALLERIGRRDSPVVEAIATEGIGVVDTFVGAVRSVSHAIAARNEASVMRIDVRRAPGASELLAHLCEEKTDPEGAAELILEHALSALLVTGTQKAVEPPPPASEDMPALPTTDAPTGFVWPAHTGRSTLRHLSEYGRQRVVMNGNGKVVLTVGPLVLRTARSQRFLDAEEARQALVRAARERTQLGPLLVPDTVLVAQPAPDGAWWLWTIVPRMPDILEAIAGRPHEARAMLDAYGVAVVDVLRTCLRNGFSVDLGPSSFCVSGSSLRYVGDVGGAPASEASLSETMLDAVDAIDRVSGHVAVFLDAFERELHRLPREELARATEAMLHGASEGPFSRLEAVFARAAHA